jgi:pimeloyl-ACP methyl ester carboxylesterase
MWQPQISGLAQYASVYAMDLRGHGESSAGQKEFSMDLFADDLAAFITVLGLKQPVILCGLSMGGYAAFAFYRKYPQFVSGLILTATKAAADSQEAKANRDKAIETAREQGRDAIFTGMLAKFLAPKNASDQTNLVNTTRSIMENAAGEQTIVKDLVALRDRPDATPDLQGIKVPTLIVHGAEDQIIPVTEAQAMHSAIPASRLVILQNAGHLLNLEQPERFNEAVANFLEQFKG